MLDQSALETVIAWQRAAGLMEVCGFCAIDDGGRQHLMRLTNNAGLPDAFEISRSEELVVRKAAEQRGWEIVAFLHTHPDDSPAMSARDAQCFARESLPWIIIGTPTGQPSQRTYLPALAIDQLKWGNPEFTPAGILLRPYHRDRIRSAR
jgi:proteasome lid subunit RPN8/RPN11